jgi:hypothetical protein
MSIFQPERKRITKTKDSLAEQGGLEPSVPPITLLLFSTKKAWAQT